ncbi:MAG: MFS transporter [Deltaproteobacteria bacterium]|nr:MFS transporter [Deltaproteobacteria bacterium]
MSRNTVLALCSIVLLLTSVATASFSLFLPPIEAEFHWSRVLATLPYTVAMIAWGVGSPLFGKLADDFGARPVILGGILIMAAGFFGMGLSQNLWQLLLTFGLLVGATIGACGLTTMTLLISKHFETSNRGRAVSFVQAATPLNPLLFAPVLFFLITAFSWRVAAMATGAMLLLVAFPLAWFGAHDPDTARLGLRSRVSWGACLPYLRNRSIIYLFLARFSCGVAFFQIAHLVALAYSKGFEPVTAAIGVSIFGASSVVFSVLAGWMSDRYGRGRILGLTYFVRGIGTLAMALPMPNEFVFYLLVIVAVGPTFGTVAVNNVMFFEAVGPRLAGVILGLSFIVHQIGSAGGPLLGSFAFDRTGTYDGFLLALGAILLLSGMITYGIDGRDLPAAHPAVSRVGI